MSFDPISLNTPIGFLNYRKEYIGQFQVTVFARHDPLMFMLCNPLLRKTKQNKTKQNKKQKNKNKNKTVMYLIHGNLILSTLAHMIILFVQERNCTKLKNAYLPQIGPPLFPVCFASLSPSIVSSNL